MKAIIKVLVKDDVCSPQVTIDGDWIDLKASRDIYLEAPQADILHQKGGKKARNVYFKYELADLGVAIKLPAGYEAIVAPRSSSFKNWGILQTNSIGVIDGNYCGNDDVWKFPMFMTEDGLIKKGNRICQFRIQLSQKATVWQKIKWLFTSGVEIEYVSSLDDSNRGGIGSTGV